MEKACRVCGQMFVPKQQRSTLCSRACENRGGKPCSVEDCEKPSRGRGLCGTHYNQQHQPNRHPKVIVQCAWCGQDCEKDSSQAKRYERCFCSMGCRTRHTLSTPAGREALARAQAAAHSPRTVAMRRLARAAIGTHGRLWVAGDCHSCGLSFVGAGIDARYCSDECRRREADHRRAGRRRSRRAHIRHVPYSKVEVWRRDGWRCHLCRRPVRRDVRFPHPLSPTIDHLVPVAAGGDDVIGNVACAHFICNSRRRDGGIVQLLLFGHAP